MVLTRVWLHLWVLKQWNKIIYLCFQGLKIDQIKLREVIIVRLIVKNSSKRIKR